MNRRQIASCSRASLEAASAEPARIPPEKNFSTWEEFEARFDATSVLSFANWMSSAGLPSRLRDLHISTRPSMTFHGNMQVAVAEARTWSKKAIASCSSRSPMESSSVLRMSCRNTGFRSSLASNRQATRAFSAERAYYSGPVASTYPDQRGQCERGAMLTDSQLDVFGSEDLFDRHLR